MTATNGTALVTGRIERHRPGNCHRADRCWPQGAGRRPRPCRPGDTSSGMRRASAGDRRARYREVRRHSCGTSGGSAGQQCRHPVDTRRIPGHRSRRNRQRHRRHQLPGAAWPRRIRGVPPASVVPRGARWRYSFVGSSAGLVPQPNAGVYGASKAGVSHFSALPALRPVGDRRSASARFARAGLKHGFTGPRSDWRAQRTELYDGYEPIHPEDIATLVMAAINMPRNVDVSRIEIFPTSQAVGGSAHCEDPQVGGVTYETLDNENAGGSTGQSIAAKRDRSKVERSTDAQ